MLCIRFSIKSWLGIICDCLHCGLYWQNILQILLLNYQFRRKSIQIWHHNKVVQKMQIQLKYLSLHFLLACDCRKFSSFTANILLAFFFQRAFLYRKQWVQMAWHVSGDRVVSLGPQWGLASRISSRAPHDFTEDALNGSLKFRKMHRYSLACLQLDIHKFSIEDVPEYWYENNFFFTHSILLRLYPYNTASASR